MREWLVIENSWKNAVFAEASSPHGYIPRDAAEALLGRDLGGTVWFTREDSDRMRAHPEWSDVEPPSARPVGGITKPHYRLDTIGFIYDAATGVFAGYLKWGGWYDISGCSF